MRTFSECKVENAQRSLVLHNATANVILSIKISMLAHKALEMLLPLLALNTLTDI